MGLAAQKNNDTLRIWGTGAFDNEAAMSWVEALEHADEQIVEETLDAVLEADEGGDEPNPEQSAHAVAAAETVAALAESPASSLPEEVRQFCFDNPELDLEEAQPKAMYALGVILQASGLRTMLEASGAVDEWESELEELRDRLRAG